MTSRLASGRSTVSPNPVRSKAETSRASTFSAAPNRPCSPPSSVPASISLVSAAPTYCRSSANPLPPPYPDHSPVCAISASSNASSAPIALSHPRWPRRHRCRPPPHRTHHHSCSRLTNLLTRCKHSVRKGLKRWGLGVYHGLRRTNLQHYLDEFVFRFNRRRTRHAAFATLLAIGVRTAPAPHNVRTRKTA